MPCLANVLGSVVLGSVVCGSVVRGSVVSGSVDEGPVGPECTLKKVKSYQSSTTALNV